MNCKNYINYTVLFPKANRSLISVRKYTAHLGPSVPTDTYCVTSTTVALPWQLAETVVIFFNLPDTPTWVFSHTPISCKDLTSPRSPRKGQEVRFCSVLAGLSCSASACLSPSAPRSLVRLQQSPFC